MLKDEEAEGSLLGNSLGYSYSYDNRRNGLNPETVLSFRFSQDLTWLENDAKFVRIRSAGNRRAECLAT